jgi:hypothetical protein
MTPESLLGAFALLDHWKLMLLQMQALPLPPLPEAQGRIHQMPQPTSPEQDAQDLATAAVWQSLVDGEGSGDHD